MLTPFRNFLTDEGYDRLDDDDEEDEEKYDELLMLVLLLLLVLFVEILLQFRDELRFGFLDDDELVDLLSLFGLSLICMT